MRWPDSARIAQNRLPIALGLRVAREGVDKVAFFQRLVVLIGLTSATYC
jgi:hypothetical protein